jgi:hypothetical protein
MMQDRQMTEADRRVNEDFDWALHSADVQQNADYFGKLVVVYKKRVLAAGCDRQAIVEQASKEVGVPGRQLVVMVVPSPEAWETTE